MKVVNLTGKPATLITSKGDYKLESNGEIKANFFRTTEDIFSVDGKYNISVNKTDVSFNNKILPVIEEDTIYLVSSVIYRLFGADRKDFYTLDEPVRDSRNNIVGFKSITRLSLSHYKNKIDELINNISKELIDNGFSTERLSLDLIELKSFANNI